METPEKEYAEKAEKSAKRKGRASYKKGVSFEQEFGKHTVEGLGFNHYENRVFVTGKAVDKGYEIDVLAKRNDRGSVIIEFISIVFAVLGVGLVILVLLGEIEEGQGLGFLGIVLGVCGFVYGKISENLKAKYTWIECKNQKTRVNRKVIIDLNAKYQDYKANKDKRWNIVATMCVSATGFEHDAKMLAREHKIILYEKDETGNFKEVDLKF